MNALIEVLAGLSWPEATALLLLENIAIFVGALLLGHGMVRWFGHRRIAVPPPPITRLEVLLAACTVVLNTLVTVVGWWLWKEGHITFRTDIGLFMVLDVVVLFMVMDFAMYVLHRIAHLRWLYPWLHRTHHIFDHPRPLTLFALNPAETLGFGGLWLVVIVLYDASWLGMSIYLGLNVVFGLMGHLGVEPLPKRWLKLPVLNWLTTSTFHAGHHDDGEHNYGFYTLIWDRLFSTLSSTYNHRFLHAGADIYSKPEQPDP